MSGPPEAPPPPAAPSPPPLPKSSGKGPLFWILFALAGLFALCCASGLIVWFVVKSKLVEVSSASQAARDAQMTAIAETMAEDELRAANDFIAAIDEERDDDAWEMTAPAFRVLTPRDKFGELTELAASVLGRCVSKEVRTFKSRTALVGGQTTASITFAAKFEKGDGTIQVELVEVGGAWKVASWRTDSPLFLDAMKRGSGK